MRRNVILMILGIILVVGSCDAANLRRIFRSKRSEADFILRSCIASAQLTRRHRTNGATQLASDEINLPNLPSTSLVIDHPKTKNFNNNKRTRLRSRNKGRHLTEKITTDTPLGTVDVKPIFKENPKTFVKKEVLPELDRHGSARNLNTDAEIIVVQPLKH